MTTETREIRFTPGGEIRLHTDGKNQKITGYAAVFDSLSEDLGGFRETIKPGTFKRALAENQDVRGLVDHDSSKIIGRTEAGTMTLKEDSKGLRYEIDVADTTAGRDIVVSIKRGDVSGSSFAFQVIADEWRTKDGAEVRELRDVDLFDVGPVAFPAYPATVTEASRRALEHRMSSKRPNLTRLMPRIRQMLLEVRGALSNTLNGLVDGMVDDDTSRGDVVASLASAAGISEDTVNEILAGGIECPPLNRLAGFARVLGVSPGRLRAAAERDGCDYGGGENSVRCLPCERKRQYG